MKKLVLFLLIMALVLPATAAIAQEEPVEGGTFHRGMVISPRGMFNPILYTETYDNEVIVAVYDGLIAINRELQPVPQIAESWEFSDDGLSLTFHLREGVKFHDGVEVTARDVEYTYKTILHPHYTGVRYGTFAVIKGAEAYHDGEVDYVEGIEVIDDYTIRFTTERIHSPLLAEFTYGILPSHILEDVPVAELEAHEFNQNPIGAGPFKFVEFRPDRYVVLEGFDDYYQEGPYLDRMVYHVIDDEARPVYLRQGRIDFVGISSEQIPMVEQLAFVDVFDFEAMGYSYICFNLRQERFDDKRIRQAVAYGYDRQTVVDIILDGYSKVANAPMPTVSWAYTDEGINEYPYNPDRSIELMQEAGWERGADGVWEKDDMRMEFEFIYTEATRAQEQMMMLFQQNMEDIGFKVHLRPMEFSAAVDRIDAREFDAFTLGWGLGVDPDPHGIWHSTSVWNDAGWVNERSDELIEKGRTTVDQDERAEIYAEWQRLMNEELPNVFFTYTVNVAAMNERVQGVDRDPGPQGLFWSEILNQLWIPAERQ